MWWQQRDALPTLQAFVSSLNYAMAGTGATWQGQTLLRGLRRFLAASPTPEAARLGADLPYLALLDLALQLLDDPQQKLAAYGSLQPGEANAHLLDGLEMHWRPCRIPGRIATLHGYKILHPTRTAVTPGSLGRSSLLPQAWPRLDAFEGHDYRRIFLPVEVDSGYEVASVYVAR